MSGPPNVTEKERNDTHSFWREHVEALRAQKLVSEEAITWLMQCTQRRCIGYDTMKGEIIRPGEIGKWDLYDMCQHTRLPDQEILLISGLTPAEIAKEKLDRELSDRGVDPENPIEVARAERYDRMSPEALNAEIKRLETLAGY